MYTIEFENSQHSLFFYIMVKSKIIEVIHVIQEGSCKRLRESFLEIWSIGEDYQFFSKGWWCTPQTLSSSLFSGATFWPILNNNYVVLRVFSFLNSITSTIQGDVRFYDTYNDAHPIQTDINVCPIMLCDDSY